MASGVLSLPLFGPVPPAAAEPVAPLTTRDIRVTIPGDPVGKAKVSKMTKKCGECSREFHPRGRAKFCSSLCRGRANARPPLKEDVTCACCGKVREVSATQARRLKTTPHLCRGCSRKAIRKGMKFAPVACAKCGRTFSARSGGTRYCDECARRVPREPKVCPVCGARYHANANSKACSTKCGRRLRQDATYFGGRSREAVGYSTKTCQVCERRPSKYHIHHVLGHPNHSVLVILCPGCHDAVSKLAHRRGFGAEQFERIRWFAVAQNTGEVPSPISLPDGTIGAQGEPSRVELAARVAGEVPR